MLAFQIHTTCSDHVGLGIQVRSSCLSEGILLTASQDPLFHNVVEMHLGEVDACKWEPACKMAKRQVSVTKPYNTVFANVGPFL